VQLYRTILLVGFLGVRLAVSPGALAQAPHGLGDVTVDDLVARVLADNPDLQATQAEVDATHGRLQQAGLRPNPLLDYAGPRHPAGRDCRAAALYRYRNGLYGCLETGVWAVDIERAVGTLER
jgi:outer membrane protein TolC